MPLKNRNLAIIAAAVVLMAVIGYGYYSLVYAPMSQTIAEDKRVVDKLNSDLASARARASQLSRIQAEMAGLQVEVAQLEKQLPKNRELPSLLRVVTHRAEAFGVSMTSLAPMKPVAKGLYDELQFNISLTASFHSLGRFLTAMGKGERLFATRNLAMVGSQTKTDPSKTLNATLQLIAFKYHE
jgi:type IV pilus assembly protein PilO